MSIVLYISFAVYLSYIGAVMAVNKSVAGELIPASVSDSFYLLNSKKKGAGYLFTIWCYIIGISVMAVMFDASDGRWFQFLSLFAGGGLCFVGTAPLFKAHERTIHFASAGTCAIASLLWIVLMGYWFVPAGFLLSSLFTVKSGEYMFWAESALFDSMYVTLFLIHSNIVLCSTL
jgi:hypothetical protein